MPAAINVWAVPPLLIMSKLNSCTNVRAKSVSPVLSDTLSSAIRAIGNSFLVFVIKSTKDAKKN